MKWTIMKSAKFAWEPVTNILTVVNSLDSTYAIRVDIVRERVF